MDDVEDALAIAEFWAIVKGGFSITDFEWDDDELIASYIDTIVDPLMRKDLTQEPSFALSEAKDEFARQIHVSIENRKRSLGGRYPFHYEPNEDLFLVLPNREALDFQALSYCWVSFYNAAQSDRHLVSMANADRKQLVREFAAIFEFICCYALAVRSAGPVWHLGKERSTATLLRRLSEICKFIGSGAAKNFKDLEVHLAYSNDGGVDVFGVYAPAGAFQKGSQAFLLGATIQKTDRKRKIVGPEAAAEFQGLFSTVPLLPFHGVLAVPFEFDQAEAERCRIRQCIYLSRAEIILLLGTQLPHAVAKRSLRLPFAQLMDTTRRIAGEIRISTNSGLISV